MNSQKCGTEKQTICGNRMCIITRGGRERASEQCTVHTNKSADTGEQIFDTLL